MIIKNHIEAPTLKHFMYALIFEKGSSKWLYCRRSVIDLHGFFSSKNYVKGELLSAVGKNGYNQIFPVCWAVVEVVNTDLWTWFIRLLNRY